MSAKRQARANVQRARQRRRVRDQERKIEDRQLNRRGFLHHASEIVGDTLFRRR